MAMRRHVFLVLLGALSSLGASYRTQNFVIEAPTPQIAEQVGQLAEQYRRDKSIEWRGQEMPPWPQPCPIRVKVTMSGAGGATTFAFDGGRVLSQHMHIEGSLDRLLASVLPHEITHTVFADYFRCPVPRWADEGGAVLSEDEVERNRHDQLVRQILNAGKAIPLRRLFALRDYPSDVMALYAEGYSVAHFLVSASNRQQFLAFVAHGMQYGWDHAVQAHYRYRNVEELEQAWLSHLRATKRQPPALLASNTAAPAGPTPGTMVRLTAPPVQPLADLPPQPVYRGQSPEVEDRASRQPVARPGYLPDYYPAPPPAAPAAPANWAAPAPVAPPAMDQWQPPSAPASPAVRLGPPQVVAPAPPAAPPPGQPVSPVGYPY